MSMRTHRLQVSIYVSNSVMFLAIIVQLLLVIVSAFATGITHPISGLTVVF